MSLRRFVLAITVAGCLGAVAGAKPPTIVVAPPGSGPVAQAHTRTWQHRRKTVRVVHRTPEVMREDASRIKRGDLFSTWANAAAN
jgi:hypothetical protein